MYREIVLAILLAVQTLYAEVSLAHQIHWNDYRRENSSHSVSPHSAILIG